MVIRFKSIEERHYGTLLATPTRGVRGRVKPQRRCCVYTVHWLICFSLRGVRVAQIEKMDCTYLLPITKLMFEINLP